MLTVNLGVTQDFSLMGWTGLTARFDVINLFDQIYEIRDGTGVGVGAPQFMRGARFLLWVIKEKRFKASGLGAVGPLGLVAPNQECHVFIRRHRHKRERASAMKAQGQSARLRRRANRKKTRTKIGPRAFIFLIVASAVLGTAAISMNMRLEDWERTHPSDHDDR